MTQTENTTESLKGKHLTYKERVQIELLRSLDKPMSGNKIAGKLGRARQTIHTEIKDGTIRQIRKQKYKDKVYEYEYYVYSADAGQSAYDKARLHSIKQPKWIGAPKFMAYADHQMKQEEQSPDAELVNTMLDTGLATLQDQEHPIIHSDRGAHYRWPGWIERMNEQGELASLHV